MTFIPDTKKWLKLLSFGVVLCGPLGFSIYYIVKEFMYG